MWGVTAHRELYSTTKTEEKEGESCFQRLQFIKRRQMKGKETHLIQTEKVGGNKFKCNHINHLF